MNTEPSRKRGGEKSSEDPSRKIPPIPVGYGCSAPHDVVLTVKGQKFYCKKEKLAKHSTYFEKMFFSDFAEKNKKEVDIGEVEPDVFQLFIDVVNGGDSISDEYSEVALASAIYLESTSFEDKILKHLAGNSEISLQEQFKMAEDHKSNKLMIQVCASIKDANELDEVVPKDLDSFCNTTKNLVMQRSFELLGIRKPPSPPLLEDPDQVFEHMMNQIIDQVEVQNHHGEILMDQFGLLLRHVIIGNYFTDADKTAEKFILEDPQIKELLDQQRNAQDQGERNLVQAQVQVLTFKHLYTRVKNNELRMNPFQRAHMIRDILQNLCFLSAILNRDERSRSRSHNVTLGNRQIDEIYRILTDRAVGLRQAMRPRNVNVNAEWLRNLNIIFINLGRVPRFVRPAPRPRPDNLRDVSNRATFQLIDTLVNSLRNFYYVAPQRDEPEHNEAANVNGN